ncbi:MAG: hypothetical protein OXC60_21120 [Litoreibacter sp.]|nr:hypothetical protein [Litoreibacter sp.]
MAAFVVLTLTNQISGFFGIMTGSHVLSVDGQIRKADDPLQPSETGPLAPLDALPRAPAGWVKITRRDAEAGDLVARVSASWPEDAVPLESHKGFRRLTSFAAIYAKEDWETRLTANRKAVGLYLSHSGSYLNAAMIYRGRDHLLGGAQDPQGWADQLEAEAQSKKQPQQVVERLTLVGIPAINITREAGADARERPLIQDMAEPTRFQLRAAFSARALISLQGWAAGQDLEPFVAGVDANRLP